MSLRVNPPTDSLAATIRAARERAVLSQVELAALLGVSPRTVQNWEAGRQPQPRHRRAIDAFVANGSAPISDDEQAA